MIGRLIFFLCVWLGFAQIGQAQKSTARFLLWQPSATSNAMGGVGTALDGNAFAAYHNPAALAFSPSVSIAGSFVKPIPFFGDVAHSFFSISHRTRAAGAFAISANILWKGNQARTFSSPDPSGTVDEFDWSGNISYGLHINNNFAIGGTIRLLKIKVNAKTYDFRGIFESEIVNTQAIMLDAGVLFKNLIPEATLTPTGLEVGRFIKKLADDRKDAGLSVGAALLNAGPKVSFLEYSNAKSDHPPTRIMLGLAYCPLHSEVLGLMLASDLEKLLHESSTFDYLHLGSEARLLSLLCLRVGYFLDTFGSKNSYFTIGGGIHTKYFSINLARYTRTILPNWHFDGTLSVELR
jgi:hypothetical protein